MVPVFGFVTCAARAARWYCFSLAAMVACNIILFFCVFVSAARIYDQGTLLHIKDSMESYFDSWNSYRRTFPPPFVCSAPECTPLYIPVGLI